MNLIFSSALNLLIAAPLLSSNLQHHSLQSSEIRRDAVTDELIAFASLSDGNGQLLVGCDFRSSSDLQVILETKLEMSRNWNGLLSVLSGGVLKPLDNSTKIKIRFNKHDAYSERWSASRRRAVVASRHRSSFINSLIQSEQLTMRFVDIEDRENTLVFDTARFSEIINPVLSLCKGEVSRRTDGE